MDAAGVTHGFLHDAVRIKTVDFPGTTFDQLLGVRIDHAYIFDRFGNVFLVLTPSWAQ